VKSNWRALLVFVAVLTIVPAGVMGGVWLYRNSDVITYDSVEGGALVSADGRTIAVTGDGMLCDQVPATGGPRHRGVRAERAQARHWPRC
jgi:hypothetical protein